MDSKMSGNIVKMSRNRVGGLIYLAYQERLTQEMAAKVKDMRKVNRLRELARRAEIGLANWYYSSGPGRRKD